MVQSEWKEEVELVTLYLEGANVLFYIYVIYMYWTEVLRMTGQECKKVTQHDAAIIRV